MGHRWFTDNLNITRPIYTLLIMIPHSAYPRIVRHLRESVLRVAALRIVPYKLHADRPL
jgi:hypothetical protein